MEERVRIQEEFERGVTKVLICTDLMTRGIDVPGEPARSRDVIITGHQPSGKRGRSTVRAAGGAVPGASVRALTRGAGIRTVLHLLARCRHEARGEF